MLSLGVGRLTHSNSSCIANALWSEFFSDFSAWRGAVIWTITLDLHLFSLVWTSPHRIRCLEEGACHHSHNIVQCIGIGMPKQFACHFAAVDVAVSAAVGVVVCWLSLNPAASSWGTPPWSGILLGPQLCFLACCTLKGKQGKGVLGPYSIYLSFLCKQKWPFSIWTYSNPFGSQLLWDTCWIFHMVEDLASTSASLSERRVKSSWKYKFCTSRYLDEKYEELKHLLWTPTLCPWMLTFRIALWSLPIQGKRRGG